MTKLLACRIAAAIIGIYIAGYFISQIPHTAQAVDNTAGDPLKDHADLPHYSPTAAPTPDAEAQATLARIQAEWNAPDKAKLLKPQTTAQKREEEKEAEVARQRYLASGYSVNGKGIWHVKHDCVGVRDKDDLSQVYSMIEDNDNDALDEMVQSGRACNLRAGTPVRPVKNADLFIHWQVRPIGTASAWWVNVGDTQD
jgi:hypothetical protein